MSTLKKNSERKTNFQEIRTICCKDGERYKLPKPVTIDLENYRNDKDYTRVVVDILVKSLLEEDKQ